MNKIRRNFVNEGESDNIKKIEIFKALPPTLRLISLLFLGSPFSELTFDLTEFLRLSSPVTASSFSFISLVSFNFPEEIIRVSISDK